MGITIIFKRNSSRGTNKSMLTYLIDSVTRLTIKWEMFIRKISFIFNTWKAYNLISPHLHFFFQYCAFTVSCKGQLHLYHKCKNQLSGIPDIK